MTEEEARTKWCPFARAMAWDDDTASPSINRTMQGKPDGDCKCIASDCAAWRWLDPDNWSATPEENRHGYCGLAGRP